MTVFTAIGAAVFGAGTFMAGLTAAGLQLAAGIAMSAIGKAMQGEPEGSKFGVQGKLQAGEDVPRSLNLGFNCTAGSLAWHGTFGVGGTMSARVIAIGDLPIREFRYPIVEGVDCTVLTGEAHPDYGWPLPEFRKGGVDHAWIKFYDGTQTVADPFLVATFGNDPERPYQASRIGFGVPYVIVFARAPERNDEGDKPLFQGVPSLKFVTFGVKWYNPALDSSVGGVGPQRANNPATWGGDGDFNPMVHLYHLLRGVRFNGQWLYGMQALSAARLPMANWIAGIAAAQASIAGPAGAEPTYRAGGEVQVGAQVATTVEALLTAANARLVESGGFYKVFVGPPGAPVMAFTDGDILSTDEQSFSPFLSLADTVNAIHASYPNPAEGWGLKKFTLLRPDLEPKAGNRRLPAPVSLDLVPYHGQVQRLAQWAMAEALRARRHTFVLGPEFRQVEAGDVVRWTSARNGYVDKLFRIDGIIYKSNLDVIVDLTEVDPSDYDWNQATDYRPMIDGPLQLVGPKPMPMVGWQVFAAEIVDGNGTGRRPSVEVRAAGGVAGVERVRVQVRVGDEFGPLIFDSDGQPYAAPYRWVLQGQFPPATAVAVRGIMVGPEAAEWSGWFVVTTPDTRLSLRDIDDAMRQLTGVLAGAGSLADRLRQLQDELAELANGATGSTITFDTQLGEARAYFAQQIAAIATEIEAAVTLTTLLAAEFGGNLAVAAERLGTVANELYSQATFAQEVAASYGGTTASAFFTMTAYAGADGWDTTVAAMVRYTDADEADEAGLYIFMKSTGEKGIGLKANTLHLLSDAGGFLSSPFFVVDGIVYMREVKIDGADIRELTVDTLQVKNGSITGSVVFTQTVEIGAGQTLVAGNVDVTHGALDIIFIGAQTRPYENSGNFGGYSMRILVDGVPVNTLPYFYDDNFSGAAPVTAFVAGLAPGLHTVSVDSVVGWGMGGFTFAPGGQLRVANWKR